MTARAFLLVSLAWAVGFAAPSATSEQTTWHLVWSDEFNGPANSLPDGSKWTYDLGNNGGWGNQELENYTSLPENAHMDGQGNLVIHVESGSAGYFSARLKTQGLFAVQYGRAEARIKLPSGQGIWPAFWMLGSDITTAGWPQCGEIDIMENIGKEPSTNHGSVHGPGYSGGKAQTATYTLPNGRKFSDDFHTFAIQWSASSIVFYVDGTAYEMVSTSTIPSGSPWVFDNPFFLLLNVAVGGNFPGPPDSTTQFPQDMLVDYVRVYQATNGPAPALTQGGVVDAASYVTAMAPGSVASVFGTSLAESFQSDLFDTTTGAFPSSVSGTSVLVNGLPASLTYVSPIQINFQIPWESLTDTLLNVELMQNDTLSNPIPIVLSSTAPSVFSVDGVAIVTCSPQAPAICTLWGNGFGETTPAQLDGTPNSSKTLAPGTNSCALTIDGQTSIVTYCGGAPGLIISQLNFTYPVGVGNGSTASAQLQIGGKTANFLVPAMP